MRFCVFGVLCCRPRSQRLPVENHDLVKVAGFLQVSFAIETRREIESRLLSLYLEGLKANGVVSYSSEQLWRDYRLGLLTKLASAIGACASVLSGEWAEGDAARDRRIRRYSRVAFERRIASVIDSDALDSLG